MSPERGAPRTATDVALARFEPIDEPAPGARGPRIRGTSPSPDRAGAEIEWLRAELARRTAEVDELRSDLVLALSRPRLETPDPKPSNVAWLRHTLARPGGTLRLTATRPEASIETAMLRMRIARLEAELAALRARIDEEPPARGTD